MRALLSQCSASSPRLFVLALAIAVSLLAVPGAEPARGNGSGEDRSEFYGIVQERPANGLQGAWVIGGRTFMADGGTEFDSEEGPLAVGSCAKVHLRNGRVHEIDSEPMGDCR